MLSLILCGTGATLRAADPVMEQLYGPELLKQAAQTLNLTEAQKTAVQAEVDKAQTQVNDLREKIRKENETLAELVKGEKVDEAKVTAQADKMMLMENEAKRIQLCMLVRLKNQLTTEQQKKLNALKSQQDRLQAKIRQAQELSIKRQKEGKDVSFIKQDRDMLDIMLRQGRLDEASELVDKMIKALQ
jgi:Spy/CpxP family protein refolding chaperone